MAHQWHAGGRGIKEQEAKADPTLPERSRNSTAEAIEAKPGSQLRRTLGPSYSLRMALWPGKDIMVIPSSLRHL